MTLSLLLSSTCLLACADTAPSPELSKEDARANTGKGDAPDYCEMFGWYGDGVCDDFCQNADPDCEQAATCMSDAQCDAGERCNADEVCLSPCAPGEVCIQVCVGFCVEAPANLPCGGFQFGACSDDQFCDIEEPPPGAMGDHSGVCRPRPELCTEEYAPVCGRDGNTYGNACAANSAGVDVASQGECEPAAGQRCGGLQFGPCDADQFCDFEDPPVGAQSDFSGVCRPRPEVCIALYAPVCGRDGQTYSNSCVANRSGADVAHDGPCAQ